MHHFRLRACWRLVAVSMLLSAAISHVAHADEARWEQLKPGFFPGDPVINENTDLIAIQAPKRAHDAAVVPVTIEAKVPQTPDSYIRKLHLIVDKNPLPLAGVFEFTPDANGWATIETRIRINEYTHVRAIAEMNDGSLHMTTAFVKAAGGCSAPAMGDLEQAISRAGKMKLFVDQMVAASDDQPAEAEIKISHPNNSGMQFDQISRNYIPAFFVHTIGASIDGKEVMKVSTNFSLSENPTVRFKFKPGDGEAKEMTVYALDSKDNRYEQTFPLAASQVSAN